jgi:hypothetical protein
MEVERMTTVIKKAIPVKQRINVISMLTSTHDQSNQVREQCDTEIFTILANLSY